jgi:cell division protein FtsI/penicillin-binding protein 2
VESRARVLFGLLLLALGGLVGRVGYVQLVRGDELAERAKKQHFRRITVPAPRGRILDRHGRPIAASYHARSVACDPREVEDAASVASAVALELGNPADAKGLSRRIERARAQGRHFLYLGRRADREPVDRIEEAGLSGMDLREEPRREYPHGPVAAAVVGMVGPDASGRIGGLTGLELSCDRRLRGVDGASSVFRSGALGEAAYHLYPEHDRRPRAGADVRTTIDVAVQQVAEDALDALQERHAPRSSCALVLDPKTGEILALAGRPALDPADFPDVSPESLRIPAVQDSYEPGSTMKPLVLAWALSLGAVHPGQAFDCGPGWKMFGGRKLSDVKPMGVLDVEEVLVRSSNIGMAQVGLAVGIADLHRLLVELGFGRPTGVEVSGEQSGTILPLREWSENYTVTSASMGHGLATTPIQLALAYAALLHDGLLPSPTLLRDAPRPAPRRIPFREDALAFVRHAMERVVEEGTGRRARVEGLRVGGKTGTSEKYPEGCGRYVSSFVAFAPVDDPAMVVLVVADEPRARDGVKPYGGVVAAPPAAEILRRGLPLVRAYRQPVLPESGVRHEQYKVRVAAVERSSVNAGVRMAPAPGRNPDSAGMEVCRSDG